MFLQFFLLALISHQAIATVTNAHFDFVDQSATNITYNFNVTLSGDKTEDYYVCFDISGVTKIKNWNSAITLSVTQTSQVHKLSDIQFQFNPSAQCIGGVAGGTYTPLNCSLLAAYPAGQQSIGGWDGSIHTCKSTTLDTSALTEPFTQICAINTCSSGACTDSNTFIGQMVIHGFQSSDYLSADPITAGCGLNDDGAVELVAIDDQKSWYNFEAILAAGEYICKDINPSYFTRSGTPTLQVNFSAKSTQDLNNLGIFFHYPGDFIASIGGNSEFGAQFISWPSSFAAPPSDDFSTCYGASFDLTNIAEQFDAVCVGNGCTGSNCGASVYIGTLIFDGFGTSTDVDWLGTIHSECSPVVNQPTPQPTKNPEVQKGWIAAIVLGSTLGLGLTVSFLWLFVVGFRRFKRQYGFEGDLAKEEQKKQPNFPGLMKHFGLA